MDFFCKIEGELNFGQVGEIFTNFQKHTTTVTFFKNGLQLDGPRVYFWDQISGFIFFPKNFKGISFVKLKAITNVGGNGGKSLYSN